LGLKTADYITKARKIKIRLRSRILTCMNYMMEKERKLEIARKKLYKGI